MHHRHYAAVLHKQKDSRESASFVDALVKHLRARGRIKLLPRILGELKRKVAREKLLASTLEVAYSEDELSARKEVEAMGIKPMQVNVNHALISGWRASEQGRLVDHSAKRALVELYQNIVSRPQ